jgi:acetolactate synthase-1/2/3 large subunit
MEAPLLEAADTILMLGVDAVELIPNPWPYTARVIALNEWVEDSPYFPTAVSCTGPLPELLAALPSLLPDEWEPGRGADLRATIAAALTTVPDAIAHGAPALAPADVARAVRRAAPAGSIATVDAGAHMLVAMPLWDVEEPGEILISSGLATMGFAVPAAIAAALARPGRRIYCFVGDGGLGMVLAELETVSRLQLPITVVVFNDSTLSLIKIKQRVSGHGGNEAVGYAQTDFVAIARGFGLDAVAATSTDELVDALGTGGPDDAPLLVDVQVDPRSYPHIMKISRNA